MCVIPRKGDIVGIGGMELDRMSLVRGFCAEPDNVVVDHAGLIYVIAHNLKYGLHRDDSSSHGCLPTFSKNAASTRAMPPGRRCARIDPANQGVPAVSHGSKLVRDGSGFQAFSRGCLHGERHHFLDVRLSDDFQRISDRVDHYAGRSCPICLANQPALDPRFQIDQLDEIIYGETGFLECFQDSCTVDDVQSVSLLYKGNLLSEVVSLEQAEPFFDGLVEFLFRLDFLCNQRRAGKIQATEHAGAFPASGMPEIDLDKI